MSKLTVHVLDMARGVSAAGMHITLSRPDHPEWSVVMATGDDGRTVEPLLEGDAFPPGAYRLVFHLADYFRAAGVPQQDPPMLARAIIEFHAAPAQSYHIPLVCTPFSYSVYRGS